MWLTKRNRILGIDFYDYICQGGEEVDTAEPLYLRLHSRHHILPTLELYCGKSSGSLPYIVVDF